MSAQASAPGGDLLVERIGELLTLAPSGAQAAPGAPPADLAPGLDGRARRDASRAALGLVRDGVVLVRGGRVAYAGPRAGLPAGAGAGVPTLDARGALVTPGLVDCHAHPIFAGSRAHEFDLRAQGAGYAEIQAAGGGILSTVRATRAAGDQALVTATCARLDRLLQHGVTTCEAKSGYDLTIPGELRLLRLLGEARRRHVVELSPTLLAHVPPPDGDRAEFVRRFAEEAIPEAARFGLADAVDVYCDQGAFTLEETRALLVAGRRAGLMLRVHAEQFTHTGVANLAASLGARSVEHLEQLGAEAPALLARAGTVCDLLPGAALTLKLPWPDGARLRRAGCRVALGTDLNPGSSYTESLSLMMSLACTQMGLDCAEAWLGVTREGAHAVGRADAGHLGAGARGDLVVWDAEDHREVPQHLGAPLVRHVVVAGRPVTLGGGPHPRA